MDLYRIAEGKQDLRILGFPKVLEECTYLYMYIIHGTCMALYVCMCGSILSVGVEVILFVLGVCRSESMEA